jgi:DNA-binding NtrC family response regulator
MSGPCALLMSTDASLIGPVKEVVRSIGRYRLEVVSTTEDACTRVGRDDVLLVMVHLSRPGDAGQVTCLLQTIAIAKPSTVTLVIGDGHYAHQFLGLLRLGVADCLSRPLDLSRLGYLIDVLTVGARIGLPSARGDEASALATATADDPFLDAASPRLARMMEQLRRIAPQDTTVLLNGETGTGKTYLAGVIHQLSARRDKPFLTVNCGSLSATLIESEMFGHAKGSFTGADADRTGKFAAAGLGTLFLDEIDSLPLDLQVKLLRAVEERMFEPVGSNKSQAMLARLIVAANRPLGPEIAAGRFRADLYYRLNVIAFELPPLRERKAAIPAMAHSMMTRFAAQARRDFEGLSLEALEALEVHDWPGNLRELRNVIERAVALSPGPVIQVDDLPEHFQAVGPIGDRAEPRVTIPLTAGSLARSKEQAERERITHALVRHGNNRVRAAEELGISRMTLYNKLNKYNLNASP